MDKKQIEEMAKDFKLCNPCEMFAGYIDENGDMQGDKRCLAGFGGGTKCGISIDLARHLIKQGYRKINENEVVISKAEYNDLKGLEAKFDDYLIKEIKETRKETAREILSELMKNIEFTFGIDGRAINKLNADFVLNMCKQFGVEIGEEL